MDIMLDSLKYFVADKRAFLSTSIHILKSVCVPGHICPKTTTECPMALISLPRVTQVTRVTIFYQLMKWTCSRALFLRYDKGQNQCYHISKIGF